MRFLLCGIGSIGQRHYKNLLSLGHEVAILRSGKNTGYNNSFLEKFFAEQVTTGHPVMQFQDFATALSDFHPDAAFITSPNAEHLDIALKAARAGLHLFIEKPVATTMTGVAELESIVLDKKLTVMIGYNLRFHPLLKKMKQLFDAGAIGTVLSADVEMGENIEDWHPWEDYASSYGPWKEKGGGVIFCFSHDIDYLYWFLGMPKKIIAAGGKMTPLKGDGEDMVKSLWMFSNGAVASLHLDYWQRPHRRTFRLVGTTGSLLWDYEAKMLTLIPHAKDGKPETWDIRDSFDRNAMFIEEAESFIAAIGKKAPSAIPLKQGVDVLAICLEMRGQLI